MTLAWQRLPDVRLGSASSRHAMFQPCRRRQGENCHTTPTYGEIQKFVQRRHGFVPTTGWITHVKDERRRRPLDPPGAPSPGPVERLHRRELPFRPRLSRRVGPLSTGLPRPRRPSQRQRVRPPEAPGRRREEDPDHLHHGPRRQRDPASPRKVRGGRAPLEARGRAGVACRDPSCNRAGRQPRRGGTKVQSPDRRTANTVGATRATRSSAIVASAQFVTR